MIYIHKHHIAAQSLSCIQLFVTPWQADPTAACQVSLSFTIPRSLPKLMSVESVMPFNHLILCHLLLFLLSIFPSQLQGLFQRVGSFLMSRLFASDGQTSRASAPTSVLPMNIQGWIVHISFRIDWFHLFAVQVTLKRLLQHNSSKASIFSTQLTLWSNSHIHTWLLEKP